MCRFCKKELPANAKFCPWCGKAQSEPDLPVTPVPVPETETNASGSKPRFSREQLDILRSLLKKHNLESEYRFSEEKISYYESTSIWGALDGSGEDVTEITIIPIHLDSFDLKDLHPGFCLTNSGRIFQCFADCVQGDWKNQIWSACRNYFGRFSKDGHYEKVSTSNSMAIHNPLGIGVDVLITYEHYSYCD